MNHTRSYIVLPYPTLPYPTLHCPTLSYLTLPYVVLPYPTFPYPTLSYLTLPYIVLTSPILLCHILPYCKFSYLTTSYVALPSLPYIVLPYPTLQQSLYLWPNAQTFFCCFFPVSPVYGSTWSSGSPHKDCHGSALVWASKTLSLPLWVLPCVEWPPSAIRSKIPVGVPPSSHRFLIDLIHRSCHGESAS